MFIKIKEGGNSMSKTIYQYLDKIDHQIIDVELLTILP